MRIIICDDEPEITEQLYSILLDFFQMNSLKTPEIITYECGEDLLSDTTPIDFVFLDIEMSGVNGIYVGNELKRRNKDIIIFIVTSYSEYLDDAMKFHVFRYLSKPLDSVRIHRNLKDALLVYNETIHSVLIETKTESFTVSASDIIYVEVMKHKVTIHTINGDFISTKTMNYWKQVLNYPSFFTSHKSFHINMKYVTSFDHSVIHLYNNHFTAYLTRRNYSNFKDTYLLYLESMR